MPAGQEKSGNGVCQRCMEKIKFRNNVLGYAGANPAAPGSRRGNNGLTFGGVAPGCGVGKKLAQHLIVQPVA